MLRTYGRWNREAMRISIIGPPLPIPPKGWGAVESLIWDYKLTLNNLGHEVQILNDQDTNKMLHQMLSLIHI